MNKKIIHSVFEHVADEFPDNVAIEEETGRTITYRELNEKANQIAFSLIESGVGRDVVVAVFIKSCIEYVASMIGVFKSGGIFMPLDTRFPARRIENILNRTSPKVFIAGSELSLSDFRHSDSGTYLPVFSFLNSNKYPVHNPPLVSEPDDGNYIVHTSGSTGEPKAILGRHKTVSHFMHWEITEFGLDQDTKTSQLSPSTNDVILRDIFAPLISGGTVCIPAPDTITNTNRLVQWLDKSGITLVHTVPSLLRLIMKQMETSGSTLNSIRQVLLVGEELYARDAARWMDLTGNRAELVNLYGSSETLAKSFHRIKERPADLNKVVPIGKPISNAALLVIKNNSTLCDIGELGEIYIKSPFIGKGYYKNPELTARSFVPNPINGDLSDIVYKTGDMGRYLPDRSIEYIGRLDTQVKIGGLRIELKEIEQVLLANEAIEQAVVLAHKNLENDNTLTCYYTEKVPTSGEDIRAFLREYLPDYMIPSFYLRLDEFPLNINGKIDKKSLPKPEELIYEKEKYEPPANDVESRLAEIWKDILELKKVGVNSPFFEIGGQSLKAIRVLSRIYKEFGTEVNIRDFFDHSTIRKLASHMASLTKTSYRAIEPLREMPYYELSRAQKRLWVMDQMGSRNAYNVLGAFSINGNLNTAAFSKTMSELVDRHESLLTTFTVVNGEPKAEVRHDLDFMLEEIDLSKNPDNSAIAKELALREAQKCFDLSKGPLFRASLLKLGPDHYVLLINIHHIICDAWSLNIFAKEMMALYDAHVSGQENPLPRLTVQYKDFAAWQNRFIDSDEALNQRSYWHNKLSGEMTFLNLPTDYPRPAVKTFNGSTLRFYLDEALKDGLQGIGRAQNASLFMVLVSILKVLLHRYTGQEDIVIGSAIAGRSHPDLEKQIGFYVNTIVMRDRLEGGESFLSVLEKVRMTAAGAYENSAYPFDSLVDELDLSRDISHTPLFDVAMNLNVDEKVELDSGRISISEIDIDWKTSKTDLLFDFVETQSGLRVDINYNTDLFSPDTIRRMEGHFRELIISALQDAARPIKDMNILGTDEVRDLLEGFNATRHDYPVGKSIVDIFEEQTEKTPHNIAVICGNTKLTYSELNQRSNQLAHCLLEDYGVGAESMIGLMIDRSEWEIIGMLGILKAGGVYVPIDPSYPRERILFMMRDSGLKVLLTDEGHAGIDDWGQEVKVADISKSKKDSVSNPKSTATADSLAYIIYTSGSTGAPKGVMVEHKGLVNMSLDQIRSFGISEADRSLQFASLSFDASMYEIFMALFSGACVVIAGRRIVGNTIDFLSYIKEKGVTVVTLPPVYLGTLNRDSMHGVKTIITAGEPASVEDATFYAKTKQYINAYGPTEASVCVSFHRVDPAAEYRSAIPIGKPISNTSIYILDDWLNLVPVGVCGEICISCIGLARGYLGRADLTEKYFVNSPFRAGERMYRTGDVGRRLADGSIEFVGRKDSQVKVRGYRIEPGEIESAIREHPGIGDVLVFSADTGAGRKELFAYFTLRESDLSAAPDSDNYSIENDLRTMLKGRLPEYMVPSYIVRIDAFPLTASGKVDRKALPSPSVRENVKSGICEAPENEIQESILRVWKSVLGLENIGIQDNFFGLGGDSIKAIQVVSRLREEGLRLEISDIFQQGTISGVALKASAAVNTAEQGLVTGTVPLTPIQSWFFEEFKDDKELFCQSVILDSKQRINEDALRAVLREVQNHHDALRMRYRIEGGSVSQENAGADYPISMEIIGDGTSADRFGEQVNQIYSGMSLNSGPMMRVALFRLKDGDRVLIVVHHLAVDGVSWRILLEDISRGYEQRMSGKDILLSPKTTSFKQWAESLIGYCDSKTLIDGKEYWQGIESSADKSFPRDTETDNVSGRGSVRSVIAAPETSGLLTTANHAYNTETNDLLLTALALTLKDRHGVNKTLLDLEGHGREPIIEGIDTSRTVGWFTSLFPFILELPESCETGNCIKHIKESLRKIPQRGIGYGILKYLTNREKGDDPAFTLKPQIVFNYWGSFDGENFGETFIISKDMPEITGALVHNTHELEMSAVVMGGQMEISVAYDQRYYGKKSMEKLCADYKKNILVVAEHCAGREFSEITPSDIDYEGISLNDLDRIIEGFSDNG